MLQTFLRFDPQNFDHSIIARPCLSRLAVALLTSASLDAAGALLQAVVRSPLGEPHILGSNAGAALAIAAVSAFRLTFPVGRSLLALTGDALLFLLILLLFSAGRSGLAPVKATLCGVALSTFVSLVTTATLILDEQTLLMTWTRLVGDLTGQGWATLGTSAWFSLGGFVLALYLAPSPNMLALDDRTAQGLGISVFRTRIFTLLTIALFCDATVSIADPIGFVGPLVSQTVRRLALTDLCVLLPLLACVDTFLLLLADIIARTLFTPHKLATGAITALIGAPVFVIMATRMFK